MASACHGFGISREEVTANALHPCISNNITFHVYVCRSVQKTYSAKKLIGAHWLPIHRHVKCAWANQTGGPTKPGLHPYRRS